LNGPPRFEKFKLALAAELRMTGLVNRGWATFKMRTRHRVVGRYVQNGGSLYQTTPHVHILYPSLFHIPIQSKKSVMRATTSVALLGVAGLGEAWRPSTAISRRCGTARLHRNTSMLYHHTTKRAFQVVGLPTQVEDASTRRNWIQRALTFSSIVLSSAAQAALANDIPELQQERRVNYPVSPFQQWLNSMLSDKDSSRDGDADGSSSSNDSSSDDGGASSSDESTIA